MSIQEVGTGNSTERPIKLGGALFTMVEPHRGHEVAYNRWYERDHFYAGCMIGSWTVAGARFVATRACKEKRYPTESPIAPDPMVGSYLAIYWILAGKFDEWTQWGVNQVNWLHANDRMFTERDHIHTLMYRCLEERNAHADGVPAELALDHRFRGLTAVIAEPAEGAAIDDVTKWFGSRPLPADLLVAFSPVPLFGDAPSDVPRDTADNRLLQLYFTDDDVLDTWDDRFGSLGRELEASGKGRILFASPFLPTVPGTDTYADQLW
ncbi:MAG: hypothetical protein ACR2IR_00350 [Acidimicrobiia bacterium]